MDAFVLHLEAVSRSNFQKLWKVSVRAKFAAEHKIVIMNMLHPLFALLASVTKQELARQVAYLKAENRILRARLPQRIVATESERRKLIRAGRKLGSQLRDLISIVTYDTFRRWVCEDDGRRKSRKKSKLRTLGRPRTEAEIRELVIRIRKETGFGYGKLLGELRKLGIKLSRQTIARILGEAKIPPVPEDDIDTWGSFLKRHAATLWECDFCTKRMWTLRGPVDVYLLVCLHLGTRRIWITPCTLNPDSAWVAQQARNFQMAAVDLGLPVKYLVHDNDTKFTQQFDDLFESAGTEVVKTAIAAPNQQAHVERFIQTLKFECLDAFVVVAERHLNHIVKQFQIWFNGERCHSARDHLPPGWDKPPEPATRVDAKNIVCTTRLGGFLKSYSRRAA